MRQLNKKSFMNEDMLQKWINNSEIDLVSVTNSAGGVTAWYYDAPNVTTVKGSDIGGKVNKLFGRKN
jgi:hypothetical protein